MVGRFRTILFICIASEIAAILLLWNIPVAEEHYAMAIESQDIAKPATEIVTGPIDYEITLLFTGDVMLGRHVENLITEHGDIHPFESTLHILEGADLTIGNFEGVIPKKHAHTPNGGMRFSVQPTYLETLSDTGFDVLSLANNHSMDHGIDAFKHTRTLCDEAGIVCGGSSDTFDVESVKILTVNEVKIGILFLHSAFAKIDSADIKKYMTYLNEYSDVQFAYIHWGDEYILTHNKLQEALAYELIDNGIDAVMGHHPHVVQDIEIYNNAPIFYSLGNFIFDQYFSTHVQQGLLVSTTLTDTGIDFELIGITSELNKSRPQRMSRDSEAVFFDRILQNVSLQESVDVENGVISIKH